MEPFCDTFPKKRLFQYLLEHSNEVDLSCSFLQGGEHPVQASICLLHRTMILNATGFTFSGGSKEFRPYRIECVLHDYNNYIAKYNIIITEGPGSNCIRGCWEGE